MCVILSAEKERPTRAEMEQAAAKNPDGAGIAWIENGTVRFKKVGPGHDAEIMDLAETVPMPYVAHFRITSVGETRPELSHPFPLRHTQALATSGKATNGVLFQNGTWREWKQHLLAAAASTGEPVGDGPLSDTRAITYLATTLGLGILETIPDHNRIAVVTKNGVRRYGAGWSEYAPGLWVSNTLWVPRVAEQAKPEWQGAKPQVISGPTKATDDDDKRTTMIKGIPRLVKDAKNKPKGATKGGQQRWIG